MSLNAKIYNLTGEVVGNIDLPEIFEVTPNDQLLSQYVRVYLANQRHGTRDTKDRSDVSGRARKPYKQKGTGSARHGSRKAPSMRGGGVAHGPKPANFSLKMSKSMRTSALVSAYASQKDSVIILEDSTIKDVKTKTVTGFINKAKLVKSVLFITSVSNGNLVLSSRNIQNVKIITAANVSAYDVLKYRNIVVEKAVIESMEVKNSEKIAIKEDVIINTKSKKVTPKVKIIKDKKK